MMQRAIIVILHAFVVPGFAKELETNHAMEKLANVSMDTLVDKLVDKLLGLTHPSVGLPKTMIGARPSLTNSHYLASLPGPPALKNRAINAIKANGNGPRCVAMNADLSSMLAQPPISKDKLAAMPGVTAPLGLFDPLGIATKVPEGRLMFYREAELKHGRVCMLAVLGLIVGDRHDFIPFLGQGVDADAPAWIFGTPYISNLPAGAFWGAIPAIAGTIEWWSADRAGMGNLMQNSEPAPGDYEWDPLGFKPKDAKGLKELQNKELNNGRLAMFATAGYIFQEQAVTHAKIWPFS